MMYDMQPPRATPLREPPKQTKKSPAKKNWH